MMRAALAFLATSALLLAAPPAAAPVPSVRELWVGPIAETKMGMELVLAGPAASCGERLKGTFSVFGSGGVPVDGTVAPHPEEGCSVRFEMPFSTVRAGGAREGEPDGGGVVAGRRAFGDGEAARGSQRFVAKTWPGSGQGTLPLPYFRDSFTGNSTGNSSLPGPDFVLLAKARTALYPVGSEKKRLIDTLLLAVPR